MAGPKICSRLNFAGDERGATAVIFGITSLVLFALAGAAIDFGRWHSARSQTVAAVDAAVLAAGRSLQLNPENTAAAIAMAQATYAQNIVNRTPVLSDNITFTVTDGNKAISAQGTATIATTLLAVTGLTELDVVSSSGLAFSKAKLAVGGNGGSNLEISLILDVTGSMCNNGAGPCTSSTKLDGMRDAAKNLINIVVWPNQTNYTSRVAIVPFSTRVRVGPDGGGSAMMQSLTNLTPTWSGWYNMCTDSEGSGDSETGGNWTCEEWEVQQVNNWKIMPCVTDRMYSYNMSNFTTAYDYTDDAPGAGKWLLAHGGDRMPVSEHGHASNPTSGTGTESDPANHWNYDGSGGCSDVAENNQILPLTADKIVLNAKLDALEAYGATAGALGTTWGWYMMSPKWSSIWAGNSAPGAYADLTTIQSNGAPLLRKVAVIFSDGVFNTIRGWKDQNQQTASTHAVNVCTAMKASGVEIYTVGFALDQLPVAEQTIARATLQACGTDLSHFFETLTVGELNQAFVEIGLQLSSLYLAK